MNNGRYCDNCETHLEDNDFESYGSWSYTCPDCGFQYRHSSELTAREQVEKFNKPAPATESETAATKGGA